MRICLISKYPPIEGGVSSAAYWFARALGERGHEVHIVTNSWEVEGPYREEIRRGDFKKLYQPPNVYVHNTASYLNPVKEPQGLSHIPYANPYIAKLASIAIEVIEEHKLQIIDSWYIMPYVISGFLAKIITGRPQVMRHAGSDLHRIFNSPSLRTLCVSLFKGVDKIVTNPISAQEFLRLGIPRSKLVFSGVGVNINEFSPKVKPFDLSNYTGKNTKGLPIITYIGKVHKTKGIYELIEAANTIKENFLLLFLCGGSGLEEFKKFVRKKKMYNRTLFIKFLAPWKIPSVIKKSTCVVMLENGSPIVQHYPILLREVMAVGKCALISRELYNKRCAIEIQEGKNVIVLEPECAVRLKEILERIIKEPSYAKKIGQNARVASEKMEEFDKNINDNIRLYEELAALNKVKR